MADNTTMRERIARRLEKEAETFANPVSAYVDFESVRRYENAAPGRDAWYDFPERDWTLESWLIFADAILDELCEPTSAMAEAGDTITNRVLYTGTSVWRAMIDAAKQERKTS